MIATRVVVVADGEELVLYEADFAEELASRVTGRPQTTVTADREAALEPAARPRTKAFPPLG